MTLSLRDRALFVRSNRDLRAFLWRIGRRASTSSGEPQARFACLLLGAMAMTLAVAALIMASATSHGRFARAEAAAPQLATTVSSARALWLRGAFGQIHDQPITVIAIAPLGPKAPLPPGVSAWPRPGEAVASAALLSNLSPAQRGIYGTIVGKIATETLEIPNEQRVYIRPTDTAVRSSAMLRISGYGGSGDLGAGGPGVGFAYAPELGQVQGLLFGTLALPGLIILVIGSRIAAAARDRRTELLSALGAGRSHRVVLNTGEAFLPVTLGVLIAAVAITASLVQNLPLPYVRTTLSAAALRAYWAALIAAVLAAWVVSMTVAVLGRLSVRRRHKTRPLTAVDRVPAGRSGICLIAALVTIWLPAQFHTEDARAISYLLALLVFCVTLPSLIGACVGQGGRVLAFLGRRIGSAGAIVAGRQLEARPARTSRLVAGLVLAIIMVGQVQLWSSVLGAPYQQALTTRQLLGSSVLMAQTNDYGPGMAAFLSSMSTDTAHLWVSHNSDVRKPVARISGSCADLASLALQCTRKPQDVDLERAPVSLKYLAGWIDSVKLTSVEATTPDTKAAAASEASLVLISRSGSNLPLDSLQRLGYQHIAAGLEFEELGEGWLVEGTVVQGRGLWVIALGLVAVLLLTLAAGLNFLADFLSNNHELAALTVLTSSRRIFSTASSWKLLAPLTFAGALGALAYLALPASLSTADNGMRASQGLALTCFVVSLVLGIILSAIASWASVRAAQRWRPGVMEEGLAK
jgi:hypothetical protein